MNIISNSNKLKECKEHLASNKICLCCRCKSYCNGDYRYNYLYPEHIVCNDVLISKTTYENEMYELLEYKINYNKI